MLTTSKQVTPFGLKGLTILAGASLALTHSAFAGPIAAAKVETACGFTIAAAHGPCGAVADPHVIAGLPAAIWTYAPFNTNYTPAVPPNIPAIVSTGLRCQHIKPDCHPALDAAKGAVWAPGYLVGAPPAGGGAASASGGCTRGHSPHADIYAGNLTVMYNAAGAVLGYTVTATGEHDPENCKALCASVTSTQTVPPSGSAAFASTSLVVDGATLTCSIAVSVSGITMANLAGGAICIGAPGQVGPPIFDLGPIAQWQDMQGMGVSRMVNDVPFPAQYFSMLQQGMAYVNIQTHTFPQGEIRGQLTIPFMQTAGDMNCDGQHNGGDVQGFVQALVDTHSPNQVSTCDFNNGDMNSDGVVDLFDIPGFVSMLLN